MTVAVTRRIVLTFHSARVRRGKAFLDFTVDDGTGVIIRRCRFSAASIASCETLPFGDARSILTIRGDLRFVSDRKVRRRIKTKRKVPARPKVKRRG